jgi:hypothetical protein
LIDITTNKSLKLTILLILTLAITLFTINIVTAVCCSGGCFSEFEYCCNDPGNICCDDPTAEDCDLPENECKQIGTDGCVDAEGAHYCQDGNNYYSAEGMGDSCLECTYNAGTSTYEWIADDSACIETDGESCVSTIPPSSTSVKCCTSAADGCGEDLTSCNSCCDTLEGCDIDPNDNDGDGIPNDGDPDPDNPDKDGDGFSDDFEITHGSDPDDDTSTPDDTDTDGDGLSDVLEDRNGNGIVDPGETDPDEVDSDEDGFSDGLEVAAGSDPTDEDSTPDDTDSDGDGISDILELMWGTDPFDADSDGDGFSDGEELAAETDPNEEDSHPDGTDTDGDGFSDAYETTHGSNPDNPESTPSLTDTDGDGISDDIEEARGSDPELVDTDGDGFSDGEELIAGSDPDDADSVPDYTDTDGDGVADLLENIAGTDPDEVDSDGDGFSDGEELIAGSDPDDSDSTPGDTTPVCNHNEICETGENEGCGCEDCFGQQDPCGTNDAGTQLNCIDLTCQVPLTSCTSCEDCDGVLSFLGGCTYDNCMTECQGQGACYFKGSGIDYCRTCDDTITSCEDYAQTEIACTRDDCTLQSCVWNPSTSICTTVDELAILPTNPKRQPGYTQSFQVRYKLQDTETDVTQEATLSFSADEIITDNTNAVIDGLAVTVKNEAADGAQVNIFANYNSKQTSTTLTVSHTKTFSHISVEPLSHTLNVDSTLTYSTKAHFSNGDIEEISTHSHTWYDSQNEAVASMSLATGEKNIVNANAEGTATITITYPETDQKTATSTLTVSPEDATVLSHIIMTPDTSAVNPGITQSYSVIAHYSDLSTAEVTDTATYQSTNTDVADMGGQATADRNIATPGTDFGFTTITASFTESGTTVTDSSVLEVTDQRGVSSFAIHQGDVDLTTLELIKDGTARFSITLYFTDGTSTTGAGESGIASLTYPQDSDLITITYDESTSEFIITGNKEGSLNLVFSYNEDGQTGEKALQITVGDADTSQAYCEYVNPAATQATCEDSEVGCWANSVAATSEYTDQTKCCGNNNDEIWLYTSDTYNSLYTNKDTCYEEKWYESTPSPVTFFHIYTTK